MSQVGFHSDVGCRENLEDAAIAISFPAGNPNVGEMHAFVVADGVGGNDGGEIASREAVVQVSAVLAASLSMCSLHDFTFECLLEDATAALRQSLEIANQAILDRIQAEPALTGMATTAVCGLVVFDTLFIAWAGDSRCYISTQNNLRQVSRDHSRIQQLIEQGAITRADAGTHPEAHAITRYLGQPRGFEVEAAIVALDPSDVVLLCTDGLTDVLSDDEIAAAIDSCTAGEFPFSRLPAELVNRSIDAGTTDNVTALCYRHGTVTVAPVPANTCISAYTETLARAMKLTNKEHDHANR